MSGGTAAIDAYTLADIRRRAEPAVQGKGQCRWNPQRNE
jgi:hypothetical protein